MYLLEYAANKNTFYPTKHDQVSACFSFFIIMFTVGHKISKK